ncbi:MAG: DNA mismatch repair endonuclease MutL, partial [Thermodesulfobacteriota bacterium]
MTTVKILPEILSNQIAAGEVVQRPSSVVKELVENSIDAGSKSITIEILKGGKSLIRVSDDGCGLARDDALLSIERYATSKIFKKEDLFSISTMGFRGEALPSIASISKFCLVTRTKDSDIGTRIEIVGGKIRDVSDTGAPVGTMVEVKNLFFNTPARKKFLKTDNTETSHIIDAVSGMALGNPGIQIRLFLNNRLHKSFSSSDDL